MKVVTLITIICLQCSFLLINGLTEIEIEDVLSKHLDGTIFDQQNDGSGDPTLPPAGSCEQESVGIQIFGVTKNQFDDVDGAKGKNKLSEALQTAIKEYCNGKDCQSGADRIDKSDIKYSSDVTERNKDLYVKVCIAAKSSMFGSLSYRFTSSTSLFKKARLTEILKDNETSKKIQEVYGSRVAVSDPPKSGLKGWQIALIVVGAIAFVALIAGAVVFMKKKKDNFVAEA